MSLIEKAVEFAWNSAKDAAERGKNTLLSEVVKRVQPDHRERATKSLLGIFARLLEDEFRDHALLQEETTQFEQDTKTFLARPSVQSWLAEPLDPGVASLNHDRLAGVWRDLMLTPLPDGFGWDIVAKRYLTKVRAAIRKDPELLAIASHETLGGMRHDLSRLAGLDPGFRLEEYRARIRARFGYLKFDCFHVTGSDLQRRIPLSQVFVPQNAKEDLPALELPGGLEAAGEIGSSAARELLDEADLEPGRRRYQEAPRRNVETLLVDPACPYAVIFGDPGSGKSALLEWRLLQWADDPARHPLPLFVEFRQCARETAAWKGDFCQYFALAADPLFGFNAHELDEYLRGNDSVLMLDGMDEVFDPDQRQALTEHVLRFQQRYRRARVVVTSRRIGFQKDIWLHSGFRLFTLQDFDLPQVELFLDRWHNLAFAHDPAEIPRLKPRLLEAIRHYPPIQELAAHPLVLTMMAVINRVEPVPRDRRALYERCADLLVHRWKVDRGRMAGGGALKCPLDLEDKRTLIEIVAHAMQDGPAAMVGNVIEEDALKRIVTDFLRDNDLAHEPGKAAREIVHQLRERTFILCFAGAGGYAFVHRTFLEFFCARYFGQRLDSSAILEQVVRPHWRDERWHELIRLLVAEKAKQPGAVRAVLDFLLEQNTAHERAVNILLAADCAIDLRNLAELGATREELLRSLEKCFVFAFDLSHEPGGEERALTDRIQASAISRWAALQPGTREGSTAVRSVVADDALPDAARRAAMQELARGWKDDPEVLAWLQDLARREEHPYLRMTAIQELARGWKDDPDILLLLQDRARQEERPDVRSVAIRELARGWKDDPGVLSLLRDHARRDEHSDVRSAAIRELARGWKDDPGVLPWLQDRARQDEHPDVRMAAIGELARGWKDDPGVLPWLQNLARPEERSDVRIAAIRELARGWKDDPDILPWLKDLARQDEHSDVRMAAIRELARGWKDDPDILPWLKGRPRLDEN
jgi:hypothetical protein